MAKAPPSFDFYYNDWIGGTYHLSHVAASCYLRLLIYQFQNGSIPDRKLTLMTVCAIPNQVEWDSIWEEIKDKFEPLDDARRGNPKMDEVRRRTIHRWETNVRNGSRGGRPARNPSVNPSVLTSERMRATDVDVSKPSNPSKVLEMAEKKPKQNPSVNPSVRFGLTQTKPNGKREGGSMYSSELSEEEDYLNTPEELDTASKRSNKRRPPSYSARFLQFWDAYPAIRKTKKAGAAAAFARLGADDRQAAIDGVRRLVTTPLGMSQFCPGPEPFLNQRRWEDDPESWQRGDNVASVAPTIDIVEIFNRKVDGGLR